MWKNTTKLLPLNQTKRRTNNWWLKAGYFGLMYKWSLTSSVWLLVSLWERETWCDPDTAPTTDCQLRTSQSSWRRKLWTKFSLSLSLFLSLSLLTFYIAINTKELSLAGLHCTGKNILVCDVVGIVCQHLSSEISQFFHEGNITNYWRMLFSVLISRTARSWGSWGSWVGPQLTININLRSNITF